MTKRVSESGEKQLAFCVACGLKFAKQRKHQTFCSSKCRKAFWVKNRTVHPSYDIWQKLDVILAKLDRIEKHLGIEP